MDGQTDIKQLTPSHKHNLQGGGEIPPCTVSGGENIRRDNLHEVSNPIFWENKKKKFQCLLTKH